MKLSIITINRNNAAGLRKTMGSVFSQTYCDFEYIVVDGASTDESVDVIKELTNERVNELTNFKWISEPDTGIYNAMNKGVRMCCGEYTLMLNSGDYLVDEHVIERVMPKLDGTDIIQGNIIIVDKGKEVTKNGYGHSNITFIEVMQGNFLHQASFCRMDLFNKYGYFDESFRIIGDTVFFARCLAFGNATFKYINQNISYYDTTGISADPEGKWEILRSNEKERYMNLFSLRMQRLLYDEDKKIKFYERLHAHWWIWGMVTFFVFINKLLYGEK